MKRYLSEGAVFLNGMKRGGTNIVWNLLQSHPELVSPVLETGQIIFPGWLQKGRIGRLGKRVARRRVVRGNRMCLRYADHRLYEGKIASLTHQDNRYRNEQEPYTVDEIENARVVSKSVGEDIFLTPAFLAAYPGSRSISVVRNGYAVCEGWLRRGIPVGKAAKAYDREMSELRRQQADTARNLVVKFEDCVEDPFSELDRMCDFLDLDAGRVGKLRIKAKKVVGGDGSHDVRFAEEGEKVWVGRNETDRYLDPAVTRYQMSRLSPEQIDLIRRTAGGIMAHFGYEV